MGIETAFIISAVLSGVGMVLQQQAAAKARKQQSAQAAASAAAQRRAEAAQKRAADLQAARRRRELTREARIRRARVISGGVGAGVGIGGTSAIRGAAGAVTTDIGATLSFLDQTRALNELARVEFGKAREIAARPITMGGAGAAVSAIGGFGLQLAGSKFGAKIFGS